uniref:Vesicle-associated membrane protein 5 n=1 Tax=Cynoglossus semilaevis TaxID=244447 RepID=A0A3P8W0Q0_CYNSE
MSGQENGKSRLEQTQKDVEEVTVIMLDNLNKAEERSGKLGELEERADSKAFEKTANKVKQKKRCENQKMKIVVISVAAVFVLIIIGVRVVVL